MIDGNGDAYFERNYHALSQLEVRALTDGDGLCYAGERYQTSENL